MYVQVFTHICFVLFSSVLKHMFVGHKLYPQYDKELILQIVQNYSTHADVEEFGPLALR